jgi:hypothetical protein
LWLEALYFDRNLVTIHLGHVVVIGTCESPVSKIGFPKTGQN